MTHLWQVREAGNFPCVNMSANQNSHELLRQHTFTLCHLPLLNTPVRAGWVRKLKLRAAMWGVISYLNSPELVAGFQRCCGLVPRDTCSHVSQNGLVHANGSGKDGPVTIHRRRAEQVNGTSRAHDSNSNYKPASSPCETKGEVSQSDLNETSFRRIKIERFPNLKTEIPNYKLFLFLRLV